MNILVACEESQRVCMAFREKGHRAFSCDIEPCSGGHPEWHIQQDVIPLLNGKCSFKTCDGEVHTVNDRWDMLICFPTCTFLCVTGNAWFNIDKYGEKAKQRYIERYKSIVFFMRFALADCEKIVIENPIGIMSTVYRKPDQIIQPFMFGDPERKATCLWIKGKIPLLKATNIVEPKIIKYKKGKGTDCEWHMKTIALPKDERSKQRSKTFPGIAQAMADQWG